MTPSILVLTPFHELSSQIAISAARIGECGVFDLGIDANFDEQREQILALHRFAENGAWGCRVHTQFADGLSHFEKLGSSLGFRCPLAVLAGSTLETIRADIETARSFADSVVIEAYDASFAIQAQELGADGLILVGHEAGGRVSTDSAFLFSQKVFGKLLVPYWVRGGIGPESAAATILSGASGVVLGEQLWLTEDSPLSASEQSRLQLLDGSETIYLADEQQGFRFFARAGRELLQDLERTIAASGDWVGQVRLALMSQTPAQDRLIPMGQEIAFARQLGQQFGNVAGVINEFRRRIDACLDAAGRQQALSPESSLSKSHRTQYPILQGPMTRVSDVAPFCQSVAENGGLPFLALSLLRGPEVRRLLTETAERMGDLSWGVGVLGFVPAELRKEQLEIVRDIRPKFAIVAGGRPSQAAELEQCGISTYLHVPSPGLLVSFLKDGSRKFIFEGRECGGHVGPRTSYTLWQSAVNVLTQAEIADPENVHIVFAGGIHDSLSAAMAATVAAPLIQRGMKFGVLMGTAYLFTPEIVASGAITEEFQRQAVECRQTALLVSGVGHATRCVATPFVDEFNQKKKELILAGKTSDEIRYELELLNIGRLRIASKGVQRTSDPAAAAANKGDLVSIDIDEQRRSGMYMIGDVATLHDDTISIRDLHESVSTGSVNLLQRLLDGRQPLKRPVNTRQAAEPLAVVGVGCLFPQSPSMREYWWNILNSFDAIREVDPERWSKDAFFSDDRFKADHVYSKWGSFLEEIVFDPLRYQIPPASLASIEPIQLLALEVTRHALEDANYQRPEFPRDRTCVIFAAAGTHDLGLGYAFRTALRHWLPQSSLTAEQQQKLLDELEAKLPRWTEDSFAGFLLNVVPGRVSNRFDLKGSNYAVDAACASSLAALQTAVEQLRSGRCDAAVVGAVDGTNNPFCFMSFAKTHALSPHGKSRPFDEGADGIGLGEGLGAIVLKRLEDAQRDGDKIYAVIRGIGSSSDGRNRSMTAPFPPGQMLALQQAYDDAGVGPETITLVESHSTGTAVGDQVEVTALSNLYKAHQVPPRHCAIGSVKSMIGHTKAAAGLASLIKTVLALQHKVIPPTIGVTKPNEILRDPACPFYVSSEARPWFRNGAPRRAGVSSFGFGGTNFHVVLEEYQDFRPTKDLSPRPAELFVWQRAKRESLLDAIRTLQQEIESLDAFDLSQCAYSVHLDQQRRDALREEPCCRLAIVASSPADLKAKLKIALNEIETKPSFVAPQGIFFETAAPVDPDQVCAVFPGQGSQTVNMMRDLLMGNSWAFEQFEKANDALQDLLPQAISDYIFPIPVFSSEDQVRQQEALNDTRVAQPAMGLMDLFAWRLLGRYGVKPTMVAGHSYGEYVALCAAGVLTPEALLRLSALRGKAIAETTSDHPGGMAAVFAGADVCEKTIANLGLQVQCANYNADDLTIVAGSTADVKRAIEKFTERGVKAKALPVTAAFHTSAMDPAREILSAHLQDVEFQSPRLPVYHNTTATAYPADGDTIRTMLSDHLVRPVRFAQQIRAMHEAGGRVFLEVGPGNVLTGLINRILKDRGITVLSVDHTGQNGWRQWAMVVARLTSMGLPVKLGEWFANRGLEPITTTEFLERVRAKNKRKSTDWLVNGGRARPLTPPKTSKPATHPGRQAVTSEAGTNQAAPVQQQKIHPDPQSVATSSPVSKPSRETPSSQKPVVPGNAAFRAVPSTPPSSPVRPSKTHSTPTTKEYPLSTEHSSNGESNAHGRGNPEVVGQFQENMAQWLELQRGQQQLSEKFLDMQQAIMLSFLQGGTSTNGSNGSYAPALMAPRTNGTVTTNRILPAPSPRPVVVNASRVAEPPTVHSPAPVVPTPVVPTSRPREVAVPKVATPEVATKEAPAKVSPNKTEIVVAGSGEGPPPTDSFRNDLLGVISDRTGYPQEMLDENLALEAELGIDSIKMVEIFNALTAYHKYLPGAGDDQEETLSTFAQLKTIKDIVGTYDQRRGQFLGAPQKVAGNLDSPKDATASAPVERMTLEAVAVPVGGEIEKKKVNTPEPTCS